MRLYKQIFKSMIATVLGLAIIQVGYSYTLDRTDATGVDPTIGKYKQASYNISFSTSKLGNYSVLIDAHELPSHKTLPYNVVSKDYFPSTDTGYSLEVDNTRPDAIYGKQEMTKVDVVFALGKLKGDGYKTLEDSIDAFSANLNAAENYIDAVVEKVETKGIGFSEEFQWIFVQADGQQRHVGSSGIFDTGITEHGCNPGVIIAQSVPGVDSDGAETMKTRLTFKGYGSTPYYDYAMFPNESEGKVVIDFTLKETNADWHTLDHSGFIFGCVGEDAKSGFSVSFSQSQISINGPGVSHSEAKPTGPDYNIHIESSSAQGEILLKINGMEVYHGDGLQFKGNNFGPYVQWGSHACSSQSVIDYYDLKMQIDNTKTLGDAIKDVAWRDGSYRFVIYATDVMPKEFDTTVKNNSKYELVGYTVSKLLNADCYLINIGNPSNVQYLNQFLNSITPASYPLTLHFNNDATGESKEVVLDKRGETYTKTNYDGNADVRSGMNNAQQFIKNIATYYRKPVDWVLVNTEVKWNTYYKDSDFDIPLNYGEHNGRNPVQKQDDFDVSTKTTGAFTGIGAWVKNDENGNRITLQQGLFKESKIYAEKWRYRHFWTFYDNPTQQEAYHLVWLKDPISLFENPGKFRVNYKRKDNPFYTDTSLSNVFDNYRYWSGHYDYGKTGESLTE